MRTFTVDDVGCYGDGTFGHGHVRAMLSAIVFANYEQTDLWPEVKEAAAALMGPMSDDAWEEDECLEWLNDLCDDDVFFAFDSGDLILFEAEDEEDE